MSKIVLYAFPGACPRVTANALEEIGVPFDYYTVNIRADANHSAEYLALNRKGKVPALSTDGKIMTENAAILAYLDKAYPQAGLLPHSDDMFDDNTGLVDLVWCSATLHPMIRQVRAPQKFTVGDPADVQADGMKKFAKEAAYMAQRLAGGKWWYGDRWSIVDVYVYWNYSTAAKGGFPLKDYPVLLEHAERVRARPSFQRALARELAAVKEHDLPVDPAVL